MLSRFSLSLSFFFSPFSLSPLVSRLTARNSETVSRRGMRNAAWLRCVVSLYCTSTRTTLRLECIMRVDSPEILVVVRFYPRRENALDRGIVA